jgi:uncharacterized membrane protein HdeD (DUF308 family)
MTFHEKFSKFEIFGTGWRRLRLRGTLMFGIGSILAFATLFNPKVTILHGDDFSLLPLCGIVVMTVGLLECFDAYIAKESKDFFLSLQNAILDVVVAFLIIFSIGDHPDRLASLIAAFLIIKGIYRMIIAYATQSPHATSTRVTSAISIFLGLLVWRAWPSSAGWFLAFCLSSEIGMRGWGLMTFADWLKSQNSPEPADQ